MHHVHFEQRRFRTIASLSRRMSSRVLRGFGGAVSAPLSVLYGSKLRTGASPGGPCCNTDSGRTRMRTVSAHESTAPSSSACNPVIRHPPTSDTSVQGRASSHQRRRLRSSATEDRRKQQVKRGVRCLVYDKKRPQFRTRSAWMAERGPGQPHPVARLDIADRLRDAAGSSRFVAGEEP